MATSPGDERVLSEWAADARDGRLLSNLHVARAADGQRRRLTAEQVAQFVRSRTNAACLFSRTPSALPPPLVPAADVPPS